MHSIVETTQYSKLCLFAFHLYEQFPNTSQSVLNIQTHS